jgi:hypothetical protein
MAGNRDIRVLNAKKHNHVVVLNKQPSIIDIPAGEYVIANIPGKGIYLVINAGGKLRYIPTQEDL